jgi:hypothetical protein
LLTAKLKPFSKQRLQCFFIGRSICEELFTLDVYERVFPEKLEKQINGEIYFQLKKQIFSFSSKLFTIDHKVAQSFITENLDFVLSIQDVPKIAENILQKIIFFEKFIVHQIHQKQLKQQKQQKQQKNSIEDDQDYSYF